MSSGMTHCKCRDCFEEVVSDDELDPDFCSLCEDAGCEEDEECSGEHSYGGFDEDEPYGCDLCHEPGPHTHEDPAPFSHNW